MYRKSSANIKEYLEGSLPVTVLYCDPGSYMANYALSCSSCQDTKKGAPKLPHFFLKSSANCSVGGSLT